MCRRGAVPQKLYVAFQIMYNKAYVYTQTGRRSDAQEQMEKAAAMSEQSSENRHKIISAALDDMRVRFVPHRTTYYYGKRTRTHHTHTHTHIYIFIIVNYLYNVHIHINPHIRTQHTHTHTNTKTPHTYTTHTKHVHIHIHPHPHCHFTTHICMHFL